MSTYKLDTNNRVIIAAKIFQAVAVYIGVQARKQKVFSRTIREWEERFGEAGSWPAYLESLTCLPDPVLEARKCWAGEDKPSLSLHCLILVKKYSNSDGVKTKKLKGNRPERRAIRRQWVNEFQRS